MFFVERESCPSCESKEHMTIYSCGYLESPIRQYIESYYSKKLSIDFEYLNGATYILDKCNNCGLVYQREIPNDFLMNKLYGEWLYPKKGFKEVYKEGSRMHALLDVHANNAREIMMLIAFLNVNPEELSFLDAGMGWGSWCLMAKTFGINVYGVELSQHLINLGKSRGINVITWEELVGKSFDFINTEQFFEHISNPLDTLRYLTKSLKPNGLVKISVPDGGDINRRLNILDWNAPIGTRNSLHPVQPLEHINCYNRFSVIKMAENAGLHEVKIPLQLQYIYSTNWRPFSRMAKNFLRPLYFNVLHRGTYLFFRQNAERLQS
jgi:2-polyprenyl-3-methyl-5-hydroxy-6-metoxy-1,4-benzoquinol methylase